MATKLLITLLPTPALGLGMMGLHEPPLGIGGGRMALAVDDTAAIRPRKITSSVGRKSVSACGGRKNIEDSLAYAKRLPEGSLPVCAGPRPDEQELSRL